VSHEQVVEGSSRADWPCGKLVPGRARRESEGRARRPGL